MNTFINVHSHVCSTSNSITIFNHRFGVDAIIYTNSEFSIGIHPWDCMEVEAEETQKLELYIAHKNCLAIGECGIDKLIPVSVNKQLTIFKAQLDLAIKYHKPVIIHCVKAYDEMIACCSPYLSKIPLLIHGFNKSQEMANQLISKGFYISINQSLILKNEFDLRCIPLNKLFLETDDKQNYGIEVLYAMVAKKLNIEESLLKEKIYSNFETAFYGKTS